MTDLGIGIAGFGSAIAGYGEIVPINSTVKKLFRLPEDLALQGNAVAINTLTGDVIRDQETGIHMGMVDTYQQVYLAIRTLKYSCSVSDFGLDFSADIINESTTKKLDDAVRTTLKSLVDQNRIEIILIKTERVKQTGLSCEVRWKDKNTNKVFPFRFSPSGA